MIATPRPLHLMFALLLCPLTGCLTLSPLSSLALRDFAPETTRSIPVTPIAVDPEAAIIVFARAADSRFVGAASEVPLLSRLDFVRIMDEQRTVVADIALSQFAAIRVSPGHHEFFAYDWASGGKEPRCVGVLRTDVSPNRIYAVAVQDLEWLGSRRFGCRHLELARIEPDDRVNFRAWLASAERVELRTDRERSQFLDAPIIGQLNLALGQRRISGEASWNAESSTLTQGDGDP